MDNRNEPFVIPAKWVAANWMTAALIGSFIWPVFLVIGEDGGPILAMLYVGGFSCVVSMIVAFPSLLLMLLAGSLLNRRQLVFRKYVIFQNIAHILIAIATFATIDYYTVEDTLVIMDPWGLFAVYTTCGLAVWNKMYYNLRKKIFTKTV